MALYLLNYRGLFSQHEVRAYFENELDSSSHKEYFLRYMWKPVNWGTAWPYTLLLLYCKCLKSIACHEWAMKDIPWSYDFNLFKKWALYFFLVIE